MMPRKHVVIIGGGFGGISAAKKLKKADVDVTLIDKTNYHLFQPLLYQVATAAMSPGDIAIPIRAVLGKRGMKVIMGHAVNINRQENYVELKNGRQINFDYLIVAPGSQYNYFGNDEWEDFAPGLKSIADGLRVRERILLSLEEAEQLDDPTLREPYLTYVIIGGGPTGVEMAGAIGEIAKRNMMRDYRTFSKNETRVFLVEAGPGILNGYPRKLSEKARETLENMGVRVLLNTPVTDIGKHQVSFKEGTIETPNIIWAAGVVASPLLSTLNAEQDKSGRVKVGDDLSIPGNDCIFVIGDAAHKTDKNGNPLPALAPVALQQGEFVAKLIKYELRGRKRKAFHYTDKGTMATIGRAKAVADIRGFKFSGIIAWLLWSVVHILFIIGFRNRFRVFVEWMWYYFTFKRGVRLITKRFKSEVVNE
ncbi:MAG TPA: NAD(P)/FAD-dependent oxidoreductase [Balneolaceae bacterium]